MSDRHYEVKHALDKAPALAELAVYFESMPLPLLAVSWHAVLLDSLAQELIETKHVMHDGMLGQCSRAIHVVQKRGVALSQTTEIPREEVAPEISRPYARTEAIRSREEFFLNHMKGHSPATVTELSESLGWSKITVRKYLKNTGCLQISYGVYAFPEQKAA